MKPEVAKALELSIAHWDENAKAISPFDASANSDDCALCRKFHDPNDCSGCPVREKTGWDYCHNSPYRQAEGSLAFWRHSPEDIKLADAFRLAAIAERDFLISLREPVDAAALPSTKQQIGDHMDEILAFFKSGAKITVIVRCPDYPDGSRDFIQTSDTIDDAIAVLQIRKTAPSLTGET